MELNGWLLTFLFFGKAGAVLKQMTVLPELRATAGLPHPTHNYWLLTPRQSFWNSLSLMINTRELGRRCPSAQLCRLQLLTPAFCTVLLYVRTEF